MLMPREQEFALLRRIEACNGKVPGPTVTVHGFWADWDGDQRHTIHKSHSDLYWLGFAMMLMRHLEEKGVAKFSRPFSGGGWVADMPGWENVIGALDDTEHLAILLAVALVMEAL